MGTGNGLFCHEELLECASLSETVWQQGAAWATWAR